MEEATIRIPGGTNYRNNEVYGTLDPITKELTLYPIDISELICRQRLSNSTSVPLGVYNGAVVHFRPDGSIMQTTKRGGLRSVLYVQLDPGQDTITCQIFHQGNQAWYIAAHSVQAQSSGGGAGGGAGRAGGAVGRAGGAVAASSPSSDAAVGGAAAASSSASSGGDAARESSLLCAYVADSSGSMHSLYNRLTCSVVDELLEKLKNEVAKPIRFFGFTYSHVIQTLFDNVDLRSCPVRDAFVSVRPDGMTAYYDAVNHCLDRLEAQFRDGDEVTVVITTDGEDNSSRQCTAEQLRTRIQACKARGWQFVVIGTDDLDVQQLGERTGIGSAAAITVGRTAQETAAALSNVNAAMQRVRVGEQSSVQFNDAERAGAYRQ